MGDGLQPGIATRSAGDGDGSGSEDGSPPDQPPGRSTERAPTLSIEDEGALNDAQRAWLADTAQRAVACAVARARTPASGGEVRVQVVDDETMSALHARHAGETGTTDVLTFDLREDLGEPMDTDIVVCVDEARRQAESRGHTVERELLLYILHGALHCLGHDDHDDGAYGAMHREEDAVLTAIGVGRVFDTSAGEGAAS
jgi:probable rRNA maturation factor